MRGIAFKKMSFETEFLNELTKNLQDGFSREQALKRCACVHFAANKMEQVLLPMRGNLNGFLEFLSVEWGWIITKNGNKIYVDENKDVCVCPLCKEKRMPALLCNCSEGFAEKMFSYVLFRPVKAKVTASILRGDKSCRYEIEIE